MMVPMVSHDQKCLVPNFNDLRNVVVQLMMLLASCDHDMVPLVLHDANVSKYYMTTKGMLYLILIPI